MHQPHRSVSVHTPVAFSLLAALAAPRGPAMACGQCDQEFTAQQKIVRGSTTLSSSRWQFIESLNVGSGRAQAYARAKCFPLEQIKDPEDQISQHVVNFTITGNPPVVVANNNPVVNPAHASVPGWVDALAMSAVNGEGGSFFNPVSGDLTLDWKISMDAKWVTDCHCDTEQDACVSASSTDPRVYGVGAYLDHAGSINWAMPIPEAGASETTSLAPSTHDPQVTQVTRYRELLRAGSDDDPANTEGELIWQLTVTRGPCGDHASFELHQPSTLGVAVSLSASAEEIEAAALASVHAEEITDLFTTTFSLIDPITVTYITVVDTMELEVPACPGDLDGDGEVGGADLGSLLASWGTASPQADINGDAVVNGADLGVLLSAWGPCGC